MQFLIISGILSERRRKMANGIRIRAFPLFICCCAFTSICSLKTYNSRLPKTYGCNVIHAFHKPNLIIYFKEWGQICSALQDIRLCQNRIFMLSTMHACSWYSSRRNYRCWILIWETVNQKLNTTPFSIWGGGSYYWYKMGVI